MPWTAFPTLTDGQVLTGAHMQIIQGNFNETQTAKTTSANSYSVGVSANNVAERIPARATTPTAQSTTTIATYGDLPSIGPTPGPMTTGTAAIVYWGAAMQNVAAGGGCLMGFAITGSTTLAASDDRAIRSMSAVANEANRFTAMHMQIGLTGGTNTFTPKYTTPTGNTATFQQRELGVFPL